MADTATDRARERIAEFLGDNMPAAECAVAVLMEDPSLLVDLALEAGGLEHVGDAHQMPSGRWEVHNRLGLHMNDEPVYRRIPTEANDE